MTVLARAFIDFILSHFELLPKPCDFIIGKLKQMRCFRYFQSGSYRI
ncbi:hypothetical protein EDC35_105172 [Thiobaca trueperi]|uniref:Uncharacterized protein n=1 Tax=Thiobaca trueperi TaxID=127458 RepID=A0A4R3N114_9GAMM|nr:hypothetical protein EDC35_105172 [Thiobaca trueperi]